DSPDDIAVFDRVRNYWYGSPGETLSQGVARGFQDFSSLNVRASASYITGSHNLKGGLQLRRATLDNNFFINHDVGTTFAGRDVCAGAVDDEPPDAESGRPARVRQRLHSGAASARGSLGARA